MLSHPGTVGLIRRNFRPISNESIIDAHPFEFLTILFGFTYLFFGNGWCISSSSSSSRSCRSYRGLADIFFVWQKVLGYRVFVILSVVLCDGCWDSSSRTFANEMELDVWYPFWYLSKYEVRTIKNRSVEKRTFEIENTILCSVFILAFSFCF